MFGISGDATRVWQFKARAFWLDGSDAFLRDPLHRAGAMMDYPLLVPIQSWWTYFHYGNPESVWGQIIAALFFIDILLLFASIALRWSPTGLILLALVVLCGSTLVLEHATGAWADIPFAAFFLESVSRYSAWWRRAGAPTRTWPPGLYPAS